MKITILTLFPEVFESVFASSIVKRAIDKKILTVNLVNIRDFAQDKRKTVDDTPYGGGAGMVIKVDVIDRALKSTKSNSYVVLLSASGKKYTQNVSKSLAKKNDVTLICGHYEGVDSRAENYADVVLSVGDYVLTGGEIPAMVIVDSITRLLPGAISPNSPSDESFSENLLEYPQYTKPENYKGDKVPQILLSGNHQEIKKWRKEKSQLRTKKYRPDLLKS